MYGRILQALFVVILFLLFSSGVGNTAPVEVRTNYAAVSGAVAPIFLAQDEGLYAKHGLKTNLKFIPSITATQAWLAGDLDIVNASNELVNSRLSGADVVYISGLVNRFVFSLYSKPEISKVSDLKGKAVGVTQPDAVSETAALVVIKESGLSPRKDVRMVYLKGMPEILAALTQGVIDAGVISPPTTLKARQVGLKELVNITAKNILMIQTGIGATRAYLKEHPDTAKNYLRGLLEGIKVARTDPERTKQAIGKYTRTTDAEVLDETYKTFVQSWDKVPYVSAVAIKTLLEFSGNPAAKSAKAEEFFDNSYLKEVERSGFVEQLYR